MPKEIVSGGHDKEFFERHYFLRLQRHFPEKWGGGGGEGEHVLVPTTLVFISKCEHLRANADPQTDFWIYFRYTIIEFFLRIKLDYLLLKVPNNATVWMVRELHCVRCKDAYNYHGTDWSIESA